MRMATALLLALIALPLLLPASAGETPPKKPMLVPLPLKLPLPTTIGTPADLAKKGRLDPDRPKPVKGEDKPPPRKPFFVPEGVKLLSKDRPVCGSDEDPIIGDIEMVTNGNKEGHDDCYAEFGPGLQHVQIDLESRSDIHAIIVWHYHKEPRIYHDVVVQVSDDPDFIASVRTLFNNDHDNSAGLGVGKAYEYVDDYEGLLIPAKGIKARYIRCYTNGSTADDMNHMVEVEVWGRPVEK